MKKKQKSGQNQISSSKHHGTSKLKSIESNSPNGIMIDDAAINKKDKNSTCNPFSFFYRCAKKAGNLLVELDSLLAGSYDGPNLPPGNTC